MSAPPSGPPSPPGGTAPPSGPPSPPGGTSPSPDSTYTGPEVNVITTFALFTMLLYIAKLHATTAKLQASGLGPGTFKVMAQNEAEETAFVYYKHRDIHHKRAGVYLSIANIVKGSLGGGILGAHVAYAKGGIASSIPINFLLGLYMAVCLHLLVQSAQLLYRRTRVPTMSYADVGEAACMCFPNPRIQRLAKPFRYTIDILISLDLFGACACYQLIISKTIKQLVEDTQNTAMTPLKTGYPHLKVYLAIMIIPMICICMIRHLKWIAKLSIVANIVIIIAIIMSIAYAFKLNPKFANMKYFTTPLEQFEFAGMAVFGMSCAGVVLPVENNMLQPWKFKYALAVGMFIVVFCTFLVSFFGYAAFLEKSTSPITLNFNIDLATKIFKGCVAAMIYVTHALNFWVPFNLCFYYIKIRVPPGKVILAEYIARGFFVIIISLIAIMFPNINALMGFLGAFCLSNMAFIWPNVITLLVTWHRPGFGKYKWKLWRGIVLITIGIILFICGTVVNFIELMSVFRS